MINGNMIGGTAPIKTLKIVDEDGVEILGVVVDQETIFTANASEDIRDGKVAATDEGVVTGSAVIPNYETSQGWCTIMPGDTLQISNLTKKLYDYTFFQCIITLFNTTVDNSVYAKYVVINDVMYESKSTTQVSVITKNEEMSAIDFNIVNNSEDIYIIRFSTYKEIV